MLIILTNRKDLRKFLSHDWNSGRYNQTPHIDRFCPVCNSGIIEDEFHFLLHCSNPTKFCDFNQMSCTELIIKLMNSQNFSVNSNFFEIWTLRFLYLSHLLYGICVKIFIMNRYILKSYTTSKNTIVRQYTEQGQL